MKKNGWRILFWICFLAFIGSVGYMIRERQSVQQRSSIYEELAKKKNANNMENSSAEASLEKTAEHILTQSAAEENEPVEVPVDFEQLEEINPDIYAWIEIPDTKVDYPIVQKEDDNLYYLNHTIEGQEGYPGSIYTEDYNQKDFSDKNTVIYGHNMKDGSMFGDLSEYMDETYMEQHPFIYIYTADQVLKYEVFAGVTYDSRHIMQSYDFEEEKQYQAFLDSIFGVRNMESYIRSDIEVTTEDSIITLSTCVSGNREDKRFLVEAVLVDEPETK